MSKLPKELSEPIDAAIAKRLYAELKTWPRESSAEAFRYEMFAKRIVAAEYGRPDAVEWARQWHADVMAEELKSASEKVDAAAEFARTQQLFSEELREGKCSNPIYQAFLDTLEDPSTLSNNAPFLCWIGPILGEFERQQAHAGVDTTGVDKQQWIAFVKSKRDAQLSARVREKEKQGIEEAAAESQFGYSDGPSS